MAWEPLKHDSGPEQIASSLERLASKLHVPSIRVLNEVFGCWEELVGVAIAAHSKPVLLKDGQLTIEVEEPMWAAEVRFFSAELVERINLLAEAKAVTAIRIRVRRHS